MCVSRTVRNASHVTKEPICSWICLKIRSILTFHCSGMLAEPSSGPGGIGALPRLAELRGGGGVLGADRTSLLAAAAACAPHARTSTRIPPRLREPPKPSLRTDKVHPLRKLGLHQQVSPLRWLPVEREAATVLWEHELRRWWGQRVR